MAHVARVYIPATLVVGLGVANSTSEMAGVFHPAVNVPE